MFCKNCGKELPDSAHFCPNCGKKVEAAINIFDSKERDIEQNSVNMIEGLNLPEDQDTPVEKVQDFTQNDTVQTDREKKKKGTRAIIVIIIIAIVVILLFVILLAGANSSEETAYDEENAEGQVDAEEETAQEESESDFVIPENVVRDPFPELDIYANPETSDPRNYISYMYSQILDGKIDGQKFWDYFVSDESKSRYIESEFVNAEDVYFSESPILSYVSNSYGEYAREIEGLEDTVFVVNGTIAYKGKDPQRCTDYVVLENGRYKYYLQ